MGILHEEWRSVPGYDGYQASNAGNIRRSAPIRSSRKHSVRGIAKTIGKDGQLYVSLRINNRARTTSVHKMVAAAFIGVRPAGYQVKHRDGDLMNCVSANLYYHPLAGAALVPGKTFGYWTLIEPAGTDMKRNRLWKCRCVCGVEKIVGGHHLRYGASKSCGCKTAGLRGVKGGSHYGWKGGSRNRGSIAWCNRRLDSLSRDQIRRGKTPIQSTAEDIRILWEQSQGRCVACGDTPEKIHLDHDNSTGILRGFICGTCNVAVAMAGDSPKRLRQLADYLEANRLSVVRTA